MDWIIVTDDDVTTLKMAGTILSKNNMRVTGLKSGAALLDYLKDNRPDLILLDIKMPDMDGFQTMEHLRQDEDLRDIPVIFLTADENRGSETRGLQLGAMDFIKKPFVPEVLVLRVQHTIQLVRLQKDLEAEVERKTKENKGLSIHVVETLAAAIDAKDAYTHGHSGRVAAYSKEIARRYGYSEEHMEKIYMMALHDPDRRRI